MLTKEETDGEVVETLVWGPFWFGVLHPKSFGPVRAGSRKVASLWWRMNMATGEQGVSLFP